MTVLDIGMAARLWQCVIFLVHNAAFQPNAKTPSLLSKKYSDKIEIAFIGEGGGGGGGAAPNNF